MNRDVVHSAVITAIIYRWLSNPADFAETSPEEIAEDCAGIGSKLADLIMKELDKGANS